MANHTKEELIAKNDDELRLIAQELDIDTTDTADREALIYAVLDVQADREAAAAPHKRARIIKKEPAEQVYVGNAADANRADEANEAEAADKAPKQPEAAPDVQAASAQQAEEPASEAPKRKRGRPSKAEIAAREALQKKQQVEETAASADEAENARDNAAETEREGGAPTTPVSHASKISDIPDFLLEQIENGRSQQTVEGTSAVLDIDEVKRTLGAGMPPVAESADRPGRGEAAADGVDFIVIKDIPVIFEGAELTIPHFQEEVRPKFRRFKDDPTMQHHLSPAPVEAAEPQRFVAPENFRQERFDMREAAPEVPDYPNPQDHFLDGRGVLELVPEGFGFLRSSDYNYLASPDDIYVSPQQIRQYSLKQGDVIEGKVKIPAEGEKFFALIEIERINGLEPSQVRDRVAFEHLVPLFPEEKFRLCSGRNDSTSCRIVDLFTPIGKGQRALIVAQPKTGKTMLMKDIANAIARNHPDTYLIMLLIDERPEEVTDMMRTVNAEVVASTFDEPAARHVKIAGIVLDKAKRMVECGHDVVIFLDSITRLARAYNTVAPTSGKILSGGVDANALQKPKRFFGAARNIEGGGSLTIIATALIDTGSKMDEVIFEEFKGTGNMELQLDRSLANKRIFPAVNVIASSTRRDDLLLDATTSNRMWVLRNYLSNMNAIEAMNDVKKRVEDTKNNEEFIATMNS